MKKFSILLASLALMLVLGAGCADTDLQDETQSKSADTDVSETPITATTNDVLGSGDIELSAQVAGKNTVNFEWQISKTLDDVAEGWRIVYGKDANPTYPSTWWFERSKTYREKSWSGLPAGKAHFRVCAVVGEKCDIYSNDVEVEIRGSPAVEEAAIEDEVEVEDETVETETEVEDTPDDDTSTDSEVEDADATSDDEDVSNDIDQDDDTTTSTEE